MVRDREFYKTIFRIALPAALQSLISFLVVVADDIMVSSVPNGMNAQAACAQVNSVTALFVAAMMGLVGGSSVLIAQYWGKKDMERIRKIFAIVVMLCLGVAIVAVLACKLFARPIVGLVVRTEDTEVTGYALQYFSIVCFSYIPFAVTSALVGMLRTIEIVKITLYTALVSLVTNVGLNYILIFGKLGFPALGVEGAAIATVIARVVELALVWYYTFHVQKRLSIRPKHLFQTERDLLRDFMKFGLPVGIADIQWALIGMLKAAIIGQLGAVFIASNNIANSMVNLGTIFTFALAGGACVVVGKAVGQNDAKRAREYSKTIQILFFCIGLVMSGLIFLLRIPFVSMYGSAQNPEVFELSVTLVAIVAVTLIGTTYHASCFVGINRGAGDSRFVALVDMICGWLIVLPATLLAAFVFHAPMPIVFLMTRIDQCFKWIVAMTRLKGNKWIKNVTRDS